ncbi:MAG: DUF4349 domain-containing protein [Actinomycetota bacterium]|nr:DUF4349 domain-containing protein [Actinomycetota bacterium]
MDEPDWCADGLGAGTGGSPDRSHEGTVFESRTSFATLTVGLTEVPDSVLAPPESEDEPGTIEKAFDQAGEVLLAAVAFLIVAVAVVLPIGILAGIGFLIFRLFTPGSEPAPIEMKREDESSEG